VPSEAVTSIRALSSVTNDAAISTLNILIAVWFVVACFILLHVAYLAIRTRRRLQTAQAVTDLRTIQILQSSRERMGVRRSVALVTHETTDFTAVYGTVAPKIVMPETLLQSLSNDELSQIFLHELAHVKRNDIPVAWLASILQALHWFNPLVWYGFQRMRMDREIACDALALSHMNSTESTSYGDTLFKLMETPVYPPALSGVVEIAGNRSQLRRRIDMISTNRNSPYRLGFAGSAVFAAAAMVLLVSDTARGHDEPKDEQYPHAIRIEIYEPGWSAFQPGMVS
jgi:bla regulator protein BlaR1